MSATYTPNNIRQVLFDYWKGQAKKALGKGDWKWAAYSSREAIMLLLSEGVTA